jgi:CheY-like chemotaxis protein
MVARAHVLLVEDDADTREVLRVILEADGFVVTPAVDGLEALWRLEELRAWDPDSPCAIVLDYMMPRFSGAQFREQQLANPAIAHVPVIIVSAISDLKQLEQLRPFAVLQKPVEPDILSATVRRACETFRS